MTITNLSASSHSDVQDIETMDYALLCDNADEL